MHALSVRSLITLSMLSCPLHIQAAAPTSDTATAEIKKALRDIEAGVQRGDSAATMSQKLYAKDVVIIGEGVAGSTFGMAEATKDTQGFWDSLGPGGQKGCRFKMIEPVVASSDAFTSFLSLTCAANPPAAPQATTLRLLYAWKKLPEGWRVVLETWGTGTIDKAAAVSDLTSR